MIISIGTHAHAQSAGERLQLSRSRSIARKGLSVDDESEHAICSAESLERPDFFVDPS